MHAVPVAHDGEFFITSASDLCDLRDLDDAEIDDVRGGVGIVGTAVGATVGLIYSIGTGASFSATAWNVGFGAFAGFFGGGPGLTIGAAKYVNSVGIGAIGLIAKK